MLSLVQPHSKRREEVGKKMKVIQVATIVTLIIITSLSCVIASATGMRFPFSELLKLEDDVNNLEQTVESLEKMVLALESELEQLMAVPSPSSTCNVQNIDGKCTISQSVRVNGELNVSGDLKSNQLPVDGEVKAARLLTHIDTQATNQGPVRDR